ncbi:hypothetical protein L1987_71402 [Smallanthus sonchifolius]|uniref:Uncharacterized protein n=1 Tax=Smallanthus sonchifolius TaxID=185202 RepID=A0ACB9ASB8_9ASTR|nr:hypothetical protein L1987_71402 [Smallanthus sonchifolius]
MDVDVAGEGSEVEKTEVKEQEKVMSTPVKGKEPAGISPEKGGRKRRGRAVLKAASPSAQKNIVDKFFQRRSGCGSGEKKEAKVPTIDLTEETEVRQRRIKTVREREIETQHGGKKLKKEGSGQTLVKEVEKGEDVMTDGEKDASVGHQGEIESQAEKGRGEDTEPAGSGLKVEGELAESKALEEDISELKTLLGVTGASGSGGGDDGDGDGEE